MRLDAYLHEAIPRLSRSAARNALREGRVRLGSGHRPKPGRRVVPGELVVLMPRTAAGPAPEPPRVLHREDDWCVVDKPAGLASVPTARHPGRDVLSLTGWAPAHRLDRFTSGCLLLTRHAAVARHFEAAFRLSRVRKVYAAILEGAMAPGRSSCSLPVVKMPESRVPGRVTAGSPASPGEAPALTEFETVARGGGRTLVRALPRTGRRHQVRVHAAALGHPVAGDLLHGGDERHFVRFQLGQPVPEVAGVEPGRHLLHARALEVEAPAGGTVRVVAPWPRDFPLALTAAWGNLDAWAT